MPRKPATIKNDDPLKYFTLQEKLGEGSYGAVYKAVRKSDGLIVAIKQVPIDEDIEDLRLEIEVMKDCDSDFVTSYYGTYFKGTQEIWIVMEYCAAGSIADMMCILDRPLDEAQIAVVCKFVLKGLQYLHTKMRKVHRDIKAGNILLNQRGRAKLADFGVAGHLSDASAKRMTVIGTPYWMAPEIVQEVGYDFKADMWSLGITAIEMAEMNPPLSDLQPMRAIFLIPTRDPPTLTEPDEWSDDFNDFIACCLTKDPVERWSPDDLLLHPFIKKAGRPGYLQPLVDEVLQKIEEEGGRDIALGFDTGTPTNTNPGYSYVSSGEDDDDDDDDGLGTIRRPNPRTTDEEEEEEEDDSDDNFGTMVRSKNNTGSTPAYMKQFQNKKETNSEYADMSVTELKRLKNSLASEKAQKIDAIRQRYAKLMLPVE